MHVSKDTDIPQTRISQIIKGKKRVTADTALRLASYFGTTAKFWLGLQNDYDIEEEGKSKKEILIRIKKNAPQHAIYSGINYRKIKNMEEIFIPDNEARKSLAQKLNLEYHDNMQDWEYEIADYCRLKDFEAQYRKSETSDNEKKSLMEIMLDCLNDLLKDKDLEKYNEFAPKVFETLKRNEIIHKGTINYWACGDFLISERIKREIKK